MNKEIAKFIFQWQHDLKSKKVPKRKWFKTIFDNFWENKCYKNFATDEFRRTWKDLQDIGLIEKKEKFID